MRLYKHKWRGHYSIYLNTADGFCKLNINPDGTIWEKSHPLMP